MSFIKMFRFICPKQQNFNIDLSDGLTEIGSLCSYDNNELQYDKKLDWVSIIQFYDSERRLFPPYEKQVYELLESCQESDKCKFREIIQESILNTEFSIKNDNLEYGVYTMSILMILCNASLDGCVDIVNFILKNKKLCEMLHHTYYHFDSDGFTIIDIIQNRVKSSKKEKYDEEIIEILKRNGAIDYYDKSTEEIVKNVEECRIFL